MNDKTPVLYHGWQQGYGSVPGFYMVDDPSGSTIAYRPDKHFIIGLTESAKRREVEIPKELLNKTHQHTDSCYAPYGAIGEEELRLICRNNGRTLQ